jgi:hypothetical protein
MGRAPLRFRVEGSLGYMIRVDVGPLLCEPELSTGASIVADSVQITSV